MSRSERFVPTGIRPTDEQTAIQTARDNTIIVQANAGAAKTTTLCLRIGQALAQGVAPERILALTYTPPARQAMHHALAKLGIPDEVRKRLRICTFDEFAAEVLLSVERTKVPRKDTPEEVAPYVRQALRQLDMDAYGGIVERFLGAQRRLKGTLRLDIAVWDGQPFGAELADEIGIEPGLLRLFKAYEAIRYPEGDHCDRPNFRWEFDATYDLARIIADPETSTPLHEIGSWPRHIDELLVDEMHDLNRAMYEIVRALLQTARTLRFCGVGDVDQVIHASAGAEQRFMERDVDLGASRRVAFYPLTATRRFGTRPAAMARHLTGKRYESDCEHETAVSCSTYTHDEAPGCEARIVEEAKKWQQRGEGLRGFAILLRHPHQSVLIENALLQARLAYTPVGFTSYLMQPEVLLVRALLAVATDDFGQLEAVATRRAMVEALVFFCALELGYQESEDETPEQRLRYAIEAIGADAASLKPFFDYQVLEGAEPALARRMRAAIDIARNAPGPDMLTRFLDTLHIDAWVRDVFVEAQRRADAVAYFDGLKRAARSFTTAKALFESLNQAENQFKRTASGLKNALRSARLRKSSLTLATIAAVKGLEFDHVLMPYLEQGEFPARLADPREERNLFYVGMTRARLGLTLLAHRERPSEFIAATGVKVD